MNLGERAAARKKRKNLKDELKGLKKELMAAGCEKSTALNYMKELQEIIERGSSLKAEYEQAGEYLTKARSSIATLLDYMAESPAEEVKKSLLQLAESLDRIYHDCSIRQDDADFQSTIECFRQMVGTEMKKGYSLEASGMTAIMLRSELENIKAVLDDASLWEAPDFLALAYYFLHEDKDRLKEMENAQRNAFVLTYFKEHFRDGFLEECARAGAENKVDQLVKDFVYV